MHVPAKTITHSADGDHLNQVSAFTLKPSNTGHKMIPSVHFCSTSRDEFFMWIRTSTLTVRHGRSAGSIRRVGNKRATSAVSLSSNAIVNSINIYRLKRCCAREMGERPFCSRLQLFAVVCSRFVVDLQIACGKTGYTVSVLSTQQPQGAIMKHFRFIHT